MKVAIAGLGSIGLALARHIDEGRVPGLTLAAVMSRDPIAAKVKVADLGSCPEVIACPAALARSADVVVEAAPASAFVSIAEPAVEAGRVLVACSGGALIRNHALVVRASASGARIVVPTGAFGGLDAVRGMAEGTISDALIETSKPPQSWAGAPYLVERGLSLRGLRERLLLFEGDALAAAAGFPANVNVAAALAMAGVGPERTRVRLFADPSIEWNIHMISVVSDTARMSLTMQGIPDPDNPRTSRLTGFSVLACLRGLSATLRIGS